MLKDDTGIKNIFENKRILITGGAGYIASNLVNAIKDCKCRIVRLDKQKENFITVKGTAEIKDITGDIREAGIWEKILDGIDLIFHFACQTSTYTANKNPRADLEINVVPVVNLLESCRKNGFNPVILFSSTVTIAGVTEQDPVNENFANSPMTIYDLHKLMAEDYIKYYIRQGILRGAILRLANVYGPGPKIAASTEAFLT